MLTGRNTYVVQRLGLRTVAGPGRAGRHANVTTADDERLTEIGCLSIHTYRKLADCKDTEKFTGEVSICEPPEPEPQANVPFYIAFLIKFILGH
jgi:hypothetical protein